MGKLETGREEFDTGRWSKALKLFQEAMRDLPEGSPELREVRVLMARCLARLGNADKAEEELLDVKESLTPGEEAMLAVFENAWRELEDTRRLTPAQVAKRRKSSKKRGS